MTASLLWVRAHFQTTGTEPTDAITQFMTIHNAIVATGIVQTADTGQLSMAAPPTYVTTGANNYGYTVYRFNDSQQATFPIFFRIDWKNCTTSGGGAGQFSCTITVGTGSNGSGTITGVVQAATPFMGPQQSPGQTTPSGYMTCAVGGDSHGLYVIYANEDNQTSQGNANGWFMLERGRDSSGVAQATSAILMGNSGNATDYERIWSSNFPGALPNSQVGAYVGWPWIGQYSEISSGVSPAFPLGFVDPAPRRLLLPLAVNTADFPPFSTFQVSHLGSTHTYMAFTNPVSNGRVGTPYIFGTQTTQIHTFAMLFE